MVQGNALVETQYKIPVVLAAWAWEADNTDMVVAGPALCMDTGMVAVDLCIGKEPYDLKIDLPRSK